MSEPEGREFQPPFMPIPSLSNFRDIGGWPVTASSSHVRKNFLFRGPDITPISPEGIVALKELGIKVVFDLRSVPQIRRAGGVREVEGLERRWCPVFGEEEYTQEKAGARYVQYCADGTDGIVEAFIEILKNGAKTAFRPILLYLIQQEADPCMIHCTTGNNRSGAFIGVLMSFLGVSSANVAEEYALSEYGLRAGRDEVVERLLRNPKFKEAIGGGEEGKRRAQRMVGAREESMLALLEEVERRWGGSEGYFREVVGLKESEIESVRDVLVDDGSD